MTVKEPLQIPMTVAELVQRLGNVPLERIRLHPPLGTATTQDLIQLNEQKHSLYELVEGVLVEKGRGVESSLLTTMLLMLLNQHISQHNLGLLLTPDTMFRILPEIIRLPDVAFIGWDRIDEGRVPDEGIIEAIPHLAIEVLSPSNRPGEMRVKREEYFRAGVIQVWEVHPRQRTVIVYTDVNESTTYQADETIDANAVISGFTLNLQTLFAELDRQA